MNKLFLVRLLCDVTTSNPLIISISKHTSITQILNAFSTLCTMCSLLYAQWFLHSMHNAFSTLCTMRSLLYAQWYCNNLCKLIKMCIKNIVKKINLTFLLWNTVNITSSTISLPEAISPRRFMHRKFSRWPLHRSVL